MIDYKKEHLERKARVIELLKESSDFLKKQDAERFARGVSALDALSATVENGEFVISVIGEFSSGKSTFLNALMGDKLLPSFSTETTATVNYLEHTDKGEPGICGEVYYKDGRHITLDKIDGPTIEKYVSTNSDENVAGNIDKLVLYLDNKFLSDNVTLVDTPGLNGILEGHTEITEDMIARSNASIFLFRADQPGTESDFKALSGLRRKVKNVFFVLNRIDAINTSDDSVENVVESLKKRYKNIYPDETSIPEFIPVSAYKALVARSKRIGKDLEYHDRVISENEIDKFESSSNLSVFENKLWEFLTNGDKTLQMLLSPLEQTRSTLQEVRASYENEKTALEEKIDSAELQSKQAELNSVIDELKEKKTRREADMKEDLEKTHKAMIDEIQAEQDRIKQRYVNKLDEAVDFDDLDPDMINNRLERDLKMAVINAYRKYGEGLEEVVRHYSSEITDDMQQALSAQHEITVPELKLEEVELDTSEFEHKRQEMEQKIDSLKDEIDKAEDNSREQRKMERERRSLEQEKKDLQEAQRAYDSYALQAMPSVRLREETHHTKESRGGILGFLGDVLFGKKNVSYTENIEDSSERDAFKSEVEKKNKAFADEMSKLNSEISKYRSADSEGAKQKCEQLERKLNDLREEKERFQRENSELIKKKYAKLLRQRKNEIRDYLEDVTDDITSKLRTNFRETRKQVVQILTDLATKNISEQIMHKKTELEIMEANAKLAQEDKNERMTYLEEGIKQLNQIIGEVIDEQSKLENVERATIREVSI